MFLEEHFKNKAANFQEIRGFFSYS